MKRDELQARIEVLEAQETLTPAEKVELKETRKELKRFDREPDREPSRGSLCSHDGARLEHRFCPTCGEALPALPRNAIEQIVEQALAKRGLLGDVAGDARNGHGDDQLIANEYAELQAAAKKRSGSWGGAGHDGRVRRDARASGEPIPESEYRKLSQSERTKLRKAHGLSV